MKKIVLVLVLVLVLSACGSTPYWTYVGKEGSSELSTPTIVRDMYWNGDGGFCSFTILVQRVDNGTVGIICVDGQTYNSVEIGEKIYIKK